MNIKRKIIKEIKKIVPIKKRILYHQYRDFPLLKDCNSEWLKENFNEWSNQNRFIPGIYNLIRFMPKNITLEEFKEYLYNIDNNFNFNKSYFDFNSKNDKFYAIKEEGITNPWSDILIRIHRSDNIDNISRNNLISLSRLREYEIEHPNMVVYDGIFNDADKKTTKKLIKEKLLFKLIDYENEMFNY